jgi:hypothetical protein
MARRWGESERGRAFFFLFRWGRTLTGLSALAVEMVSFWICTSVPFFDLRSAADAAGFPSREPTPPPPDEDCWCDDAPAPEAADGSEVMRSTSVVPEEWPRGKGRGEWEISGEQEACLSRGTFRVGRSDSAAGTHVRDGEEGEDGWRHDASQREKGGGRG